MSERHERASHSHTESSTGHDERRSAPRRAIEVEVSMTSESQFFVGLSGDLSTGGLFVSTYRSHEIGSRIDVTFVLPSGTVHASGTVRWSRLASDDGAPGVGICFDALAPADRALIQAFCDERAPIFYDMEVS